MLYEVRWIAFGNQNLLYPTVLQQQNGPCPIIALCNVLFLRGQLMLSKDAKEVSFEQLVTLTREYLQRRVQEVALSSSDPAQVAQSLQLLEEVTALLPKLEVGLDVNVRFHSPSSFESDVGLALFDLSGCRLMHGWVFDPQDADTARVVGDKSYNQLINFITSDFDPASLPADASDEDKSAALAKDMADKNIARQFLSDTQSQLTVAGLSLLQDSMQNDELAVLFRNNHFSVFHKRNNNLYSLVTDQAMVLAAPYLVWHYLSDVRGDDLGLDQDFKIPHPTTVAHYANRPAPPERAPQSAGAGNPFAPPPHASGSSAIAASSAPVPPAQPTAEQLSVMRAQQEFAKQNGLVWNEARQMFEVPPRQAQQQQQRRPYPQQQQRHPEKQRKNSGSCALQ